MDVDDARVEYEVKLKRAQGRVEAIESEIKHDATNFSMEVAKL